MALSGPTLGSFVFATAANLAARLIRWLFALEQGGISTGRCFFPIADRLNLAPLKTIDQWSSAPVCLLLDDSAST